MKICIPIEDFRGLDSPVCAHFGSAPFFLFVDTEQRTCDAVENGNQHHTHGACSPLAALQGRTLDGLCVGGIGRGALMALGSAGIPVYRAHGPTAGAVVEQLQLGQLERVTPESSCAGHGHGTGCGH